MNLSDDPNDVIDFWVENYYEMKRDRDHWQALARIYSERIDHYEAEMKRLERIAHG